MLHLQAPANDLLNGWQTYKILRVPYASIDATLVKKAGIWNLFHRCIVKGQKGVNTFRATTDDLDKRSVEWNYLGPAKGDVNDIKVTDYGYQEAPYSFYWKGYYWLLTDHTSAGFPVYRSDDLESWKFMGELMKEDGEHELQKGPVRHPGVVVLGDRAFVFYFCQPFISKRNKKEQEKRPDEYACYVHVTELFYKEGKLTADRNKKVIPPTDLRPANGTWGFVAD